MDVVLQVTAIDWATNLWPQDLFAPNDKSEKRKTQYPKTQKYVLMSKAGSYTDFHIVSMQPNNFRSVGTDTRKGWIYQMKLIFFP